MTEYEATETVMVLIPLSEYKNLVERDVELSQLEVCGVDNWSGWGDYNDLTGWDGAQEVEDARKACEKHIYIPPQPATATG